MLGLNPGVVVGLLGAAVLLAGLGMALDRKVGNFGRSVRYFLVAGTLLAFALLVGFGYVEHVVEWAVALVVLVLVVLGGAQVTSG